VDIPIGYDDLEIVAVDINDCADVLPLRVIAVYRPHNYLRNENVRLFSYGCVRLCVLVDFHHPHFNWDLFIYSYRSAADFVCNHGLTQLVNEPTRVNSILDLIQQKYLFAIGGWKPEGHKPSRQPNSIRCFTTVKAVDNGTNYLRIYCVLFCHRGACMNYFVLLTCEFLFSVRFLKVSPLGHTG